MSSTVEIIITSQKFVASFAIVAWYQTFLLLQTQTCSERPLSFIMSQVLGTEVKENVVHSLLVCKKCFKLFNEVDELEQRLLDLKVELVSNYKKSLHINQTEDESGKSPKHREKSDGKDATTSESNPQQQSPENKLSQDNELMPENELPKKILDIPSSDDETQVMSNFFNFVKD